MSDPELSRTLFGGDLGWSDKDWTASDDRVRGGSSRSYLRCQKHSAVFHGHLDTTTLGGAGFASQRTVSDLQLDLSIYDGIYIVLDASDSDKKKYTFILKDEILPRNPENGREQSTISWEFDFEVPQANPAQTQPTAVKVFVPWHGLRATYRGKEKKGVHAPNLTDIKRLSIMMRSFFDAQQGDFKLTLLEFRAVTHKPPPKDESQGMDASSRTSIPSEKNTIASRASERSSLWHWLLGRCGRL